MYRSGYQNIVKQREKVKTFFASKNILSNNFYSGQ